MSLDENANVTLSFNDKIVKLLAPNHDILGIQFSGQISNLTAWNNGEIKGFGNWSANTTQTGFSELRTVLCYPNITSPAVSNITDGSKSGLVGVCSLPIGFTEGTIDNVKIIYQNDNDLSDFSNVNTNPTIVYTDIRVSDNPTVVKEINRKFFNRLKNSSDATTQKVGNFGSSMNDIFSGNTTNSHITTSTHAKANVTILNFKDGKGFKNLKRKDFQTALKNIDTAEPFILKKNHIPTKYSDNLDIKENVMIIPDTANVINIDDHSKSDTSIYIPFDEDDGEVQFKLGTKDGEDFIIKIECLGISSVEGDGDIIKQFKTTVEGVEDSNLFSGDSVTYNGYQLLIGSVTTNGVSGITFNTFTVSDTVTKKINMSNDSETSTTSGTNVTSLLTDRVTLDLTGVTNTELLNKYIYIADNNGSAANVSNFDLPTGNNLRIRKIGGTSDALNMLWYGVSDTADAEASNLTYNALFANFNSQTNGDYIDINRSEVAGKYLSLITINKADPGLSFDGTTGTFTHSASRPFLCIKHSDSEVSTEQSYCIGSADSNSICLAFEDNHKSGTDMDYNDIIISIENSS